MSVGAQVCICVRGAGLPGVLQLWGAGRCLLVPQFPVFVLCQ